MGRQNKTSDEKSNENCKNLEQQNYQNLKSEWLSHNNGQILLPGRFIEYDLILGIGSTCNVTEMLRYFGHRRFSSPFDWTAGMEPSNWYSQPNIHRDTRFHEKIQAICDNFKDWTKPEYFKYVNAWEAPNTPHHHVVNTKTRIRYIHEFPTDQGILQYFPEFIEKTNRRIDNLFKAIQASQKILIVWMTRVGDQRSILEKNVPDVDIKWAIKQTQKLYPHKIFDFIFFEPDETKKRFEYDKIEVAPGAYRIKSNHFLLNPEYNFIAQSTESRPHIHVISEMLDNIHLSEKAFALPPNYKDDD